MLDFKKYIASLKMMARKLKLMLFASIGHVMLSLSKHDPKAIRETPAGGSVTVWLVSIRQ